MIVIYVPEAQRMTARGRRRPPGGRRGDRHLRSRGRSSRPASHSSPENANQFQTEQNNYQIHENSQKHYGNAGWVKDLLCPLLKIEISYLHLILMEYKQCTVQLTSEKVDVG